LKYEPPINDIIYTCGPRSAARGLQMEPTEVLRFIKGLVKKHGADFSLDLKYLTANDKIKKRHGEFVALVNDLELVLRNRDKGSEGRYEIARIVDVERRQ
jgi:hypothetical protein